MQTGSAAQSRVGILSSNVACRLNQTGSRDELLLICTLGFSDQWRSTTYDAAIPLLTLRIQFKTYIPIASGLDMRDRSFHFQPIQNNSSLGPCKTPSNNSELYKRIIKSRSPTALEAVFVEPKMATCVLLLASFRWPFLPSSNKQVSQFAVVRPFASLARATLLIMWLHSICLLCFNVAASRSYIQCRSLSDKRDVEVVGSLPYSVAMKTRHLPNALEHCI